MSTDHLPIVDHESRPFWEALEENRLLLRFCTACDRFHFFPRVYCPFCWNEAEWREGSGLATVYTTTTVRLIGTEPFRGRLPYNLSIVELDEGPRMLTNVIGIDPEKVTIGMRVELAAQADETGFWMPWFRPTER